MATFTIGEEVMYDEIRFVIAGKREDGPTRYRLLATRPEGARIVWATEGEIGKMRAYTEPRDDTGRV
jgi:hypothetical protein